MWPFNIFVCQRDDNLPNKILREDHLENIKLRHFFGLTPSVVFPSPLFITGIRIPHPWTSGGGHPFPWYLVLVFARGKVIQEAVLILNHNALPPKLINIFLVFSSSNIVALCSHLILLLPGCFRVQERENEHVRLQTIRLLTVSLGLGLPKFFSHRCGTRSRCQSQGCNICTQPDPSARCEIDIFQSRLLFPSAVVCG